MVMWKRDIEVMMVLDVMSAMMGGCRSAAGFECVLSRLSYALGRLVVLQPVNAVMTVIPSNRRRNCFVRYVVVRNVACPARKVGA